MDGIINTSVTCVVGLKNDLKSHYFLDSWFLENLQFSTEDRVAFPFVMWLHNFSAWFYDNDSAYNKLDHGL